MTLAEAVLEAAPTGAAPPPSPPSLKVLSWCRRTGPPITPSARELLQSLGDHCGEETGTAFPSINDLAEDLDLTPRQVYNLLRQLQDARLIAVTRPDPSDWQSPNEYRLAGADSAWEVTVPYRRITKRQVFDLIHRVAELEAALGQPPPAPEPAGGDGGGRVDEGQEAADASEQAPPAAKSRAAPAADEEVGEIESALQDRWDSIGPDWYGGFPKAQRWYTRRGRCRARNCEACGNYPDAGNPHRVAFWQRVRAAEFETSRVPDSENTAQAGPPLEAPPAVEVPVWPADPAAAEAVSAVVEELGRLVPADIFHHLGDLQGLALSDGELVIGASTQREVAWLERRMLQPIRDGAQLVLGRGVEVRFVVGSRPAAGAADPPPAAPAGVAGFQ